MQGVHLLLAWDACCSEHLLQLQDLPAPGGEPKPIEIMGERLVAWREEVAVVKRRSFADEPYWGRPITGWGSPRPRILVLGLAPAAHGGNRTGRVFTGDRSGDQLFAALYRAGLVNSPISVDAADGLSAKDIRIAAAVRCADAFGRTLQGPVCVAPRRARASEAVQAPRRPLDRAADRGGPRALAREPPQRRRSRRELAP